MIDDYKSIAGLQRPGHLKSDAADGKLVKLILLLQLLLLLVITISIIILRFIVELRSSSFSFEQIKVANAYSAKKNTSERVS